ncbi:MAG TPA: hypothetical protein VHV83_12700 [Armatimonadota bacterium]|nr:hypothetical protein [Armatimonadota bacterium]
MRCCPKCGEKFDDHDIRTICSTCLESLVPCKDDESSSPLTTASGPITVGTSVATQAMTMPSVTTTLPTISIPEMRIPDIPAPTIPTEVPQVPPAPAQPQLPQQPEPSAPPITPGPDPDYPQPTVIPEPEPVPTPSPIPTPAPPTPTPPPEPVPTAHAKAIPAGKTPKPTKTSPVQQHLTQDEQSTGNFIAVALAIAGGTMGLVAAIHLFTTSPENFGLSTLIFNGLFIFLGVWLIRHSSYRRGILRTKMALLAEPRFGAPLPLEVTIGVLRTIPITEGTLTITADEEAVSGKDNGKKIYHSNIFTRTVPVKLATRWQAGSIVKLNPQFILPIDGVASLSGRYNKIVWKAKLWIGIPGWYPDIRLSLPLPLLAVRLRGDEPEQINTNRYSLPNLGDINAVISLECATGSLNTPRLHVGRKVPFSLQIIPNNKPNGEKLSVELSYHITGSGNEESVVVEHIQCFRNGWKASVQQQENGFLTIPRTAPATHDGTHINVSWSVTVYRETGWHKNSHVRQVFAANVVPDEVD